jgi:hypothetical protein
MRSRSPEVLDLRARKNELCAFCHAGPLLALALWRAKRFSAQIT